MLIDGRVLNDFIGARFPPLDSDQRSRCRKTLGRSHRPMQDHVLRSVDAAGGLGLGEVRAAFRAYGVRGRPLETDWENRMGNDSIGPPGVYIAGQMVAESGSVCHRPTRIYFVDDGSDLGADQ
jgi:hypothetical protein